MVAYFPAPPRKRFTSIGVNAGKLRVPQSVGSLSDGSFRIWYASRKKPPFLNLYCALNTARWAGPGADKVRTKPVAKPQ